MTFPLHSQRARPLLKTWAMEPGFQESWCHFRKGVLSCVSHYIEYDFRNHIFLICHDLLPWVWILSKFNIHLNLFFLIWYHEPFPWVLFLEIIVFHLRPRAIPLSIIPLNISCLILWVLFTWVLFFEMIVFHLRPYAIPSLEYYSFKYLFDTNYHSLDYYFF